jgi:hypothetical protein
MDPQDVRLALTEEVQQDLLLVASGHPIDALGPTLENLSRCLQSLAICHLLESGVTTKFRDNLARSAFARRFFLSRSAAAGNTDDRRLGLSRTEAFFDALAAGHGALAREIAALSIDSWRPGWEYEDDFYYVLFLHRVVQQPTAAGEQRFVASLQRFEASAETDTAAGTVLRSLMKRDEALFSAGLVGLMQERDQQMQERKARLLEPDVEAFVHWPRTFVSVEGLALITIARALKMTVADDVPLCPPIARLELSHPAVEDPFLGIEAELRKSSA